MPTSCGDHGQRAQLFPSPPLLVAAALLRLTIVLQATTIVSAVVDYDSINALVRERAEPVSLSNYWQLRRRLIDEDHSMSLGASIKLDGRETAVSHRLLALKIREFDRRPFLAALHFEKVRRLIGTSPVYDLIHRMPKGSMLHVHDLSVLSVEKTVQNITYMDGLYLCNNTQEGNETDIRLKFFRLPDHSCQWQKLSEVRQQRGSQQVDIWLERHLSLHDASSDLAMMWTRFERLMSRMLGMLSYDLAWRRYIQLALEQLAEDNVQYVEIRSILPRLSNLDGKVFPAEHTAEIYQQTFDAIKHSGVLAFGGRIIFAPNRHVSDEQMVKDVNLAIQLRRQYPRLMAGFDLVGREDLGRPLKDFVPQLMKLVRHNVPTFFHAGETYWQGTDVDENLVDAVLLNTTRIGHGYALVKHPALLQEVIRRDIAVEVCPLSNQVLGLLSDLRNHPAAVLLASGRVPVVVSSDDPGSWGAAGLSYDLYVTFMALGGQRADLRLLKQLAINSIRYSSLDRAEKRRFMQHWRAKWTSFIHSQSQS